MIRVGDVTAMEQRAERAEQRVRQVEAERDNILADRDHAAFRIVQLEAEKARLVEVLRKIDGVLNNGLMATSTQLANVHEIVRRAR